LDRTDFQIGVLPNRPVGEIAELAAHADELGFGGLWIADSQSIFRDAWQALAVAATRTMRLALATGVTNPVTRHAAVIAGGIATLDELSGRRAVLGIGVGESAVRTAGLRPATLARLEEVTLAIRSLLAGETVVLDGAELRLSWPVRPVPIWFASSGPRSLELAGRISDGVLFQVGSDPNLVRYGLEHIERGVDQAGRDPRAVKRYVRLACTVGEDGDSARAEARGYVAAAAGTVYANVPAERMPEGLREDLRRVKEQYDYARHASGDAAHAVLITDRIIDAIAVAGTPDEAVPRLRELLELGADGFVVPISSRDPQREMTLFAEHVLPALEDVAL
jgi:5,10-methylenetetrahydromethanopterin reductase